QCPQFLSVIPSESHRVPSIRPLNTTRAHCLTAPAPALNLREPLQSLSPAPRQRRAKLRHLCISRLPPGCAVPGCYALPAANRGQPCWSPPRALGQSGRKFPPRLIAPTSPLFPRQPPLKPLIFRQTRPPR